jgi:hypothetical protein
MIARLHERTWACLFAALFAVTLLAGAPTSVVVARDDVDSVVVSIKSDPRYQDAALLEKAWTLPVAKAYRESFEYQINPAFCGPATAVNVLKSIGVAKYKQSNVFDATKAEGISFMKTLSAGLTLDELGRLIGDSSGWKVQVIRDISYEQFLEHLKKSNNAEQRYTINFTRALLWSPKAGGGHHSPIGGYLEKEDLVFVLDVYDPYKPFLVGSKRLYEAMDTIDTESNEKRGLLLLTH